MGIFATEFDNQPHQCFIDEENHFGAFVYQSRWTTPPMP
jgi:hypothetical protein